MELKGNPNLDGWSISRELFAWIKDKLPLGATILEFGSGNGTKELAKFYNVISIEHNKEWIGVAEGSEYHHAPKVDGWYNKQVVEKAIKGRSIKAIIVDGPPGTGHRNGIINFLMENSYLLEASIIVDDTNRKKEKILANNIADIAKRKAIHIDGHEKSFDVI